MNIHHTRHHQAYVNNANAAAERWPELAKMKVEDVLRDLAKAPEAVRRRFGITSEAIGLTHIFGTS